MIVHSSIEIQFLAGVKFGMPSKKCQNFGICRIIPITDEVKLQDAVQIYDALAVISIFSNHYVEMGFIKSCIKQSQYKKHFASGMFMVKEHYHFDQLENRAYHFSISPGNYSIRESDYLMYLNLPVARRGTKDWPPKTRSSPNY